jgi:peptide chain release factor subunit 1
MISKFFEEISLDTGMIVFGVTDTMKALESSAIKTVMVWEDIDVTRFEVRNPVKGDTKVFYLNKK